MAQLNFHKAIPMATGNPTSVAHGPGRGVPSVYQLFFCAFPWPVVILGLAAQGWGTVASSYSG
jgi:hypothetical protein